MRAATGRTTAAASAVLAALVLTTAARPTAAQNGQTDLDALVGWPFPSALTAAPASPVVAWVRNERGARNIWTAAAPGWSGRRLTSFTRDDGQEITQLAVSADGSLVAFVRGGAPNRAGEIPNPESDPAGVDREIWVAPTDGSGAQRLGPGHSPVLSPDGAWVIHIDRGVIQRRPARDPSASPEPLVRGRGSPGELRLSPDGTHLAWTSGRGDHAFIGVLDLESGTLRYLDPSLDQDGNPAWSPDGQGPTDSHLIGVIEVTGM